jgi:N-acyl-D-amino-acid deacylase
VISAGPANSVGSSIAEIAGRRGLGPVDAVFALLIECEGAVNILEYNQSDESLRQTLCRPLSLVISDGFYVKGRPHPRLHGTFPLLLGKIGREMNWMTLPEAIRKITSAPAERFGLQNRGRLRRRYLGDITVLDPNRVASPATYENPARPPEGIVHVFAHGTEVEAI